MSKNKQAVLPYYMRWYRYLAVPCYTFCSTYSPRCTTPEHSHERQPHAYTIYNRRVVVSQHNFICALVLYLDGIVHIFRCHNTDLSMCALVFTLLQDDVSISFQEEQLEALGAHLEYVQSNIDERQDEIMQFMEAKV